MVAGIARLLLRVAQSWHMRHRNQRDTTPVPWRLVADRGVYALCTHKSVVTFVNTASGDGFAYVGICRHPNLSPSSPLSHRQIRLWPLVPGSLVSHTYTNKPLGTRYTLGVSGGVGGGGWVGEGGLAMVLLD